MQGLSALVDFINRAPVSLSSRFRVAWMQVCGARILGPCRLEAIRYRRPDEIRIGRHVGITHGSVLYPHGARTRRPKIIIGDHVFINFYCFIDAGLHVEIKDHVMIGPYVYITDGDHGTDASRDAGSQRMTLAPVIIEEGAWIGAHACILKGVRIGRNSVVGAGAVVTRDVKEGDVVAGSPARSVRTGGDGRAILSASSTRSVRPPCPGKS